MSDTELIDAFISAERRWLAVLAEVRALHERTLGKKMTPVQWLPDGSRGIFGWLGYYWETPPFWFGFGRHAHGWLPLIECDIRRCDPAFILQLEANLPSSWQHIDRLAGRFWRLWAPAGSFDPRDQVAWLADRSRELHEFTVV